YLDQLRPQANASPDLGVELAAAYQQAGVLEESSTPAKPAGTEALASYTKAVDLLNGASSRSPNDARINTRLGLLTKRIGALGGTVPVASAPTPSPARPAVPVPD